MSVNGGKVGRRQGGGGVDTGNGCQRTNEGLCGEDHLTLVALVQDIFWSASIADEPLCDSKEEPVSSDDHWEK